MAILKSVVNVNNGNTGWTRQNVLDALETTFANLGWNGGSTINGSPVLIEGPGYNFDYCGGPAPSRTAVKTRRFYVTNNGTSSYSVLEQFGATSSDLATDSLTITRHGLQTGDPLVYNPYNLLTSSVNFAGYTTGQTYYVIRVDDNIIKLALTTENASAGTAVDLTAATGNTASIMFRRASNVLYNNYTIDVVRGDTLDFTIVDTTSGGDFFLIDSPTTGYAANRVLRSANMVFVSYQEIPTNSGSGASGSVSWNTTGWKQTETEHGNPLDPDQNRPNELQRYGYGNSTNAAMRGEIRILPSNSSSYTLYKSYYKYTVPASGGRSALKLRVYRKEYQQDNPYVSSISIHSIGSGWQSGDIFTIPGSAIGGVDGTNDILVGVNSATTAQQSARNGVCSVVVTNYGAGSSMYQKSSFGHFAILKNINDAAKTYGTTYYGFGMDTNNYTIHLTAGMSWQTLNRYGTSNAAVNQGSQYGYYGGEQGLDYAASSSSVYTSDNSTSKFNYATTSTPTAYPLAIRTYKAQSPQDTNFAVIQFTQTINNVIIPFATFSLHKGPLVGANVWDLNYVWNAGYTQYSSGTRSIAMDYLIPRYQYGAGEEIPSNQTVAREANYGYLRNSSGNNYNPQTVYECNIDTSNTASGYYSQLSSGTITYYRNSTYDKYSSNSGAINYSDRTPISVSASANYYKPMKGLPIDNRLMPCPYYLPDDYVMLQVATSPGLTQFRPGDTVAVSAGEVYEIILAGYQTQQNGLDNVESNQSMGMLFCARTT